LSGILTNKNLLSVYPVVEGDHLFGALPVKKINELTRENWEQFRVGDIYDQDFFTPSIDFKATAWEAFQKMLEGQLNNLFVTDHEMLRGIVTVRDMVNYVRTAK
jgi:predicted transcriptional regulator